MDSLRNADTLHLNQAALTQGGVKLLQLSALRDQLVGGAKDATALRASITSAVADIRAYTSEARNAAAAAQGATVAQSAQAALYQANEAARGAVTGFMHDYYDQHVFDPYLKFASAKDEEEFRRREDERKRDMEKERALHTPEGDLKANQLAIEQLKDAGAHGADRSSKFAPMLQGLEDTGSKLSAQIDASKSADPAKAQTGEATTTTKGNNASEAVTPDVIAALRAAKVAIADQTQQGHGVSARDNSAVSTRDRS